MSDLAFRAGVVPLASGKRSSFRFFTPVQLETLFFYNLLLV